MKRILCYGDSNTWGYSPLGGRYDEDTRWTGALARMLGAEYRVLEEGLNGRTFSQEDPTEGGYKSGIAHLPVCLMSQNPVELVIVMLGTNDCKSRFGLNATTIAHNLNEFARVTRAYACDAQGKPPRVLVIAPPCIGDWLDTTIYAAHFGADAPTKSQGLAQQYRRYCKLLHMDYLDASQCVRPSKIDAVHLTSEGHQALAAAIADKVRAILT